jgi:hypothetical protein
VICVQFPQAAVERLESEFRSITDRKFRDRLQIILMAHKGRMPRPATAWRNAASWPLERTACSELEISLIPSREWPAPIPGQILAA